MAKKEIKKAVAKTHYETSVVADAYELEDQLNAMADLGAVPKFITQDKKLDYTIVYLCPGEMPS